MTHQHFQIGLSLVLVAASMAYLMTNWNEDVLRVIILAASFANVVMSYQNATTTRHRVLVQGVIVINLIALLMSIWWLWEAR